MPTINENTEKSHREEYRIRYVPNAIDNKDGSFKHGFMVQGRTVNHPKLGSSVWENEKAHHTLDDAKKHVDTTIKNDKTGKSHYMAHNEGGVHDGNNMGLHEEIENDTIPPLVDTLIDKNYVDLRANVHEVLQAKAMDIIDRIRVSVAENFLDKKEDKDDDDKDDDDDDDKKDKDDKDDDKKEKSDKDDDSKEDGKKDKKFPFFGKKKVDESFEELDIGDEVYIIPEGYSVGDKVNMTNPKAIPQHQIVGKTKTHYSIKNANGSGVSQVPKSRVAKVNKKAWELAKQDPDKLQKRIKATKE